MKKDGGVQESFVCSITNYKASAEAGSTRDVAPIGNYSQFTVHIWPLRMLKRI